MNFSQDLLEKIFLLVLTAAITGFLIPYIFKIIDERKAHKQKEIDDRRLREQKKYEASLLRQNKIIDAQVQLLNNLSTLLWEYQLLAIEVAYYHPIERRDLYLAAVDEYQQKTGTTFAKIRAEISKALYLTSNVTYEELKRLYYQEFIPLDGKLYSLIKKQGTVEEGRIDDWGSFLEYAGLRMADTVDRTLNSLAKEIRLENNMLEGDSRK